MTSYRDFKLCFQDGDPCSKSPCLFDTAFKGTLKIEKVPIESALLGEISEKLCVVWGDGKRR